MVEQRCVCNVFEDCGAVAVDSVYIGSGGVFRKEFEIVLKGFYQSLEDLGAVPNTRKLLGVLQRLAGLGLGGEEGWICSSAEFLDGNGNHEVVIHADHHCLSNDFLACVAFPLSAKLKLWKENGDWTVWLNERFAYNHKFRVFSDDC